MKLDCNLIDFYEFILHFIDSRYEDVYFKLFEKLGWQRAAAITEDGQKYTEYITRMEHNDTIKILSNKKFPRENDERKQAERFEKVIIYYLKFVNIFLIITFLPIM